MTASIKSSALEAVLVPPQWGGRGLAFPFRGAFDEAFRVVAVRWKDGPPRPIQYSSDFAFGAHHAGLGTARRVRCLRHTSLLRNTWGGMRSQPCDAWKRRGSCEVPCHEICLPLKAPYGICPVSKRLHGYLAAKMHTTQEKSNKNHSVSRHSRNRPSGADRNVVPPKRSHQNGPPHHAAALGPLVATYGL